MSNAITQKALEQYSSNFLKSTSNKIAMNAAVANGINDAASNYEAVRNSRYNFSLSIDAGEITDQKKSGRCWMFAALNVMRLEVMERLNLETMELSQSYPLFYDKLEKANYFLENILQTLAEPTDGRLIHFLLTDPLSDGGQWDMFVNLVEKYGVVPKEAMPESVSSSNTAEMSKYLTLKLREYASTLRESHSKGSSMQDLRDMKSEMMETIYRMLCISLGKPPVRFTYETRNKEKDFIRISAITPQEFYQRYVSLNLHDYISLINAPTKDKPYNQTYTVRYLGNVSEGAPVKYLNLPIEELKRAAIAQMKDKKAVWFGSDVGQFSLKSGLMDLDCLDVDKLYDTTFGMTKAQRLDYGESLMTHAMVLTGVNLDENGTPDRWRVENSWGKEAGKDGFYVMSDSWFDQFVYQVVVHKKHLTTEQLAMLDMEPIVLAPWDPMGSLA